MASDSRQPDDHTLMKRYAQGDMAAFEALYARHKGGLYRYLVRHCRNEDRAAELFQEVWARVVKARADYRPLAKFTTWLYRLAHNVYVDHVRRVGRRPRLSLVGGSTDRADGESAGAGEPPDAAHRRPDSTVAAVQTGERILEALGNLPDEQRQVFLLREETDMTLAEIAEATGTSRETVKSRLRYAVAKLRGALADCIGEAS
ncbi:MAG: RNA polymerase sigma factor [Gammaproteobacteria bacterium]|nr:RNA polymerase sigma factor [Gammaproteobacteria bacterium]